MNRFRAPVKRQSAERYLLLMLVSFACTVVLTRLFLQATGYPQIGSGVLHVAHVLWGGLLLFAATLLTIIFANRWVYTLVALSGGIGVGLFIDEIGKFITQNNDYFFPFAAPIIYAFFLLSVLIYLQVRRPTKTDARVELYHALDQVMELIENDLDENEHADLEARLGRVIAAPQYPEQARLAEALLAVLNSDTITISRTNPTLWQRLIGQFEKFEQRFLTERRYRVLLVLGLAVAGVSSLIELVLFGSALFSPQVLEELVSRLLLSSTSLNGPASVTWFLILLLLSGITGLMMLIGGGLLFIGRTRLGSEISFLGLLFALTTVNLLLFYFNQFAAVSTTLWEFALLVAVLRYRLIYLGIGSRINAIRDIVNKPSLVENLMKGNTTYDA
jgi:hypothetical protein